jgi:hypothetical protein
MMKWFVAEGSIVRQIWGKADTVLFIFAGASAEFALNKAVDWLYFTGKLPADPLGRLFSTVLYARRIIFSDHDEATKAIDQITAIHQTVEGNRGSKIPDWAYRDVLFLLIDYSIRSFEVLERKLCDTEKAEIFEVFYRVGERMGINGLPATYPDWQLMREQHLKENLIFSVHTAHLYSQYKKHLGWVRYRLLMQIQRVLVPTRVAQLLSLNGIPFISPLIGLYKLTRYIKLDSFLKATLLPVAYKAQIQSLDVAVR